MTEATGVETASRYGNKPRLKETQHTPPRPTFENKFEIPW